MDYNFINKTYSSINNLERWLIKNDFKGYDPFDGLNSFLSGLTFNIPFLRRVIIQLNKRFPVNLRPYIGISPEKSSKGIAYIVRGDINMYKLTGGAKYIDRAKCFLEWLENHSCDGYKEYCWGNHFDYQTRGYYLKKGNPTLVWTALTGRAFVDAYNHLKNERYLKVIDSVCQFILDELPWKKTEHGVCISYIKDKINLVHNANLLGAAMLAQGYELLDNVKYKNTAAEAVAYSAHHQRKDGSWYYGEENKYHWIDNWHTAYNLDSIKLYQNSTGDKSFSQTLEKGFKFYKNNFFLENGTPKYYVDKVLPIDIQCASQSIDTLTLFREYDTDNLLIASKIANWTIDNMQDKTGYFYQWKNRIFTNKTPTLHWGQATMYKALTSLLLQLEGIYED